MDTNKILSALSYFSFLFAGIIFPLVVYLVSDDLDVKRHSKKALFSHLIPFIPIPLIIIGLIIGFVGPGEMQLPIIAFIGVGLTGVLSFIVLIWNIVKGVQVLKNE